MNMANHPYPRTARLRQQDERGVPYDVTIRLAVHDPAILWRTAAAYLLTFDGVDEAVLEETIGPREDPCVENCLSAIFGPTHIPGMHTEIFAIRPGTGNISRRRRVTGG